jgi:hypothetical protein
MVQQAIRPYEVQFASLRRKRDLCRQRNGTIDSAVVRHILFAGPSLRRGLALSKVASYKNEESSWNVG